MKLFELAKQTIEILKSAGEEGIINLELAKELDMPRRRIYDIIAILKAAELIKTTREKNGTKVAWIDPSSNIPEIAPLPKAYGSSEPDELISTQNSFNQNSPHFQNTDIPLSKPFSDPFERILIDSPFLKIRTTSKITRITPIGNLELLVECENPGFIVETQYDENRKIKEVERALAR
ncbi:MAG: hypothetical protein ACFFCD_05215 [Promethearchaeota archaeon]